ncbi:SMC-Scp complex subunit ScpB [Kocuria palustris]|uniref:SMC-Scp complex subunit ScpB n=1 Tax=Kocuria palustris TaxID=71999 RepID=UPI00246902F2|nr:SMC-Scp complex subunit ScpB [Kocuria palustris]MDH5152385.1 SMC-Scp complex subunit ScpB [Kocuria palustris]
MTEQHEPAPDGSADEAAASSPGQEISAGVVDVDTLPGGLAAGIEAVLMVAERPVSEFDLAEVLGQSVDEIRATLDSLRAEYDGLTGNDDDPVVPRGFELRKVGGGWRFYSRAEFAPVVQAFVLEGQTSRLSQAAMETLAVIAYRQPVSRARVSAIRGVNVDGVVRTLVARGLVQEMERDPLTGALLYGTTPYFLEKLGLDSISELPQISPYLPGVEDVGDYDG